MTPLSFIYFVVGLVSLFWPLALLLFKRRVLGVQWMMMTALILFGVSVVVYSTFFNTFLTGDYLLIIIFMILSLMVLPVTQASVAVYTRPHGVPRTSRLLAIPSLVTIGLMVVSVAIGGANMYRLWIERGNGAIADTFYVGSWRYNLIVLVHYYIYWIVLMAEEVYVLCYVAVSLRRFRLVLNEYYTTEQHNINNIRGLFWTVGANCLCVFLNYIFFPFNSPRPLWAVLAISVPQAVAVFMLGRCLYRIDYSAERLGEKLRGNRYSRGNLHELGLNITRYVEEEQAFLNPDLSVFALSERFKEPEDNVVDAIHRQQGTSFGDYIDSLRVEHAAALLMEQPDINLEDPDQLAQLAHRCGFLGTSALQDSFARVMQENIEDWSRR